jgi:pyruvate-formate lyase-activating enzyme
MERKLVYVNAPGGIDDPVPPGWSVAAQERVSQTGFIALVPWERRDEVGVAMLEDAVASHRASGAEITVADPAFIAANVFAIVDTTYGMDGMPDLRGLKDVRINRYVPSLDMVRTNPSLRQAIVKRERGLIPALTESCDLACRMCPFYGSDIPEKWKGYYRAYMRRREGHGHATVVDFMHWVDTFRPYLNMRAVSVFGPGEPFLHPGAADVIQACRQRGLVLNFATNGNRITQNQLDAIKTGCIGTIVFSLDALTSETYKKIKPSGDFLHALRTLEQLLELRGTGSNISINISFIRQECNAHEENDFVAYWKEKADCVVVTSKYYGGRPESAPIFTPHAVLPCTHLENSVHVLTNGDCWSCSAGAPDEFFLGNVDDVGPQTVLENLDRFVQTRIDTGEAGQLCRDCLWWSQTQRIETWSHGRVVRVDQPFSYRVFGENS